MPKKAGEKTKGISVTLKESLLQRLDEFCKQHHGAPRSTVVVEAIEKFLDGEIK